MKYLLEIHNNAGLDSLRRGLEFVSIFGYYVEP